MMSPARLISDSVAVLIRRVEVHLKVDVASALLGRRENR